MTSTCTTWSATAEPLGPAVVALGAFDGVHLGHRELVQAARSDAVARGAHCVALTFDRDPDQVVTPLSAAPQLLTLGDKCRFLSESGADIVLVVPFTTETAAVPPERFLDEVLGSSADVRSIHVGRDFRFGARAAGTVETLREWSDRNGVEVHPHELFELGGAAVTSTRIRALVTAGDVGEAAALLGRPTRVSGKVHRGRMQGRQLGFPTANVVPEPFAALPADGVYAGYAELSDGTTYPAAISVGTPPTFPEARDYLEAHLIGYDGDLYDEHVTLSFAQRLRVQRAFSSLDELTSAIGSDVATAAELLGHPVRGSLNTAKVAVDGEVLEDGTPVVEDPAALERAEEAARRTPARTMEREDSWVPVTGPRRVSSLFGEAGVTAALLVGPLDAAGIPYAWDPYDPRDMPSYRYGYGAIDRPFTLHVPAERVDEARALLGVSAPASASPAEETTTIAPLATAVAVIVAVAFAASVLRRCG